MSDEDKTPESEEERQRKIDELEAGFAQWRSRVAQARTRFTMAARELAMAMAEVVINKLECTPTGDTGMSIDFGVNVTVSLCAADMAAIKARREPLRPPMFDPKEP